MEDKTILAGCEVGCITLESELIACPLSKEEADKCPRRLGYLVGIKEVVEWVENNRHPLFDIYGWRAKRKGWRVG